MTMEQVALLLKQTRLRFGTEAALQDDIEKLLTAQGIKHVREFRIGRGAIDFRLDCGIGLECKVDGSVASITPQLMTYAESPTIQGLLLVTSKARMRYTVNTLRGKPFGVVWVGASSL